MRAMIKNQEYRGYRGFDIHVKQSTVARGWSWKVCESDATDPVGVGWGANRHMARLHAKEFIDQQLENES